MFTHPRFASACCVLVLSACGGGGSPDSAVRDGVGDGANLVTDSGLGDSTVDVANTLMDGMSREDSSNSIDVLAIDASNSLRDAGMRDVLNGVDIPSGIDVTSRPDVLIPLDVPPSPAVVIPSYYASARTAQVWAVAQESPSAITLRWATVMGRAVTAVSIDRKPLAATNWGAPIANPSPMASEWTDATAVPGTLYEYRVRLTTALGTAYGYVVSGIRAVIDGYQGRIAIVVDSSLQPMLAAELNTLQDDLYGDGWIPVVQPVARNATPASVRNSLIALSGMSPDLRAVYLLGHVPVAYAGNNNPDGHANRLMSADGYYGELTSMWNNNAGCTNNPQQALLTDAPSAMNTFCNGDFPSTLELEVGRVDMSNLPAIAGTELALLRAYLNKAHAFKIRQRAATVRAFIKDGLGESGYATGVGAWSTYAGLVGPSNIAVDNRSATFSFTILNGQSHAFAFGSYFGAGCNGSVNGVVGSTQTVANTSWGGVFNHTIGSYWGEFNCQDNFLRSLLTSGDALSNAYNALQWFFHPMAMGQTLGFSALRTMNNKATMLYSPLGSNVASTANSHLGLMGDPSLRMQYIAPPTGLTLANNAGRVEARWAASVEAGIDGYHVYQSTAAGVVRLTAAPIAGTNFVSMIAFAPGVRLVVRAIKFTTSNSGSYLLPSVGAVARVP